jgi:hypothetical protein
MRLYKSICASQIRQSYVASGIATRFSDLAKWAGRENAANEFSLNAPLRTGYHRPGASIKLFADA